MIMTARACEIEFWTGTNLPSVKNLEKKVPKKSENNSLLLSIEDAFEEITELLDLDDYIIDDICDGDSKLVDDMNTEWDSVLCSLHTHDGSIEMQKLLQNGWVRIDQVISRLVYLSICSALDLSSLACAMYGNFCIQKLFEFGDIEWSSQLFMAMVPGNVWKICSSSYGCWVMQTMINRVNHECIKYLVSELSNDDTVSVMDKISHANCNHVLQQIIKLKLPFEQIQFISDCIFWDAESISFACQTQFGCRVAQALIKNYSSHIDFAACFVDDVVVEMSSMKYGNFVIGCILENIENQKNGEKTKSLICTQILLNPYSFEYLSCNKFGSNVVEKCLHVCNKEQKNALVMSMKHEMALTRVANDRFGNYVIKTLVKKLDQKQQKDNVLRLAYMKCRTKQYRSWY